MSSRRRYAIVGTGARSRMYIDAACRDYRDHAELVGLCDTSQVRMAYWNRHITTQLGGQAVPAYATEDFDRMIAEQKPDVVIVCTIDCYHHIYIIRAMELGCDVVCEKPMTTDEVKARAIFDAIERTGKHLRVTFNLRYSPAIGMLRQVLLDGAIGTPTHVDFQWYLDTSHGADYFRRWHREMDKSGGLLVHKSTHHFDAINFLIGSYVESLFAMGDLRFYGRANAESRGEAYDYDRYTGRITPEHDPFAVDLSGKSGLKGLYLDAEAESGYIRDRNVFGDNIDIYDTHALVARYRTGVIMNYSMFAYSPWEGQRITINGTRGQVEYFSRGEGYDVRRQADDGPDSGRRSSDRCIRLQKMFEPAQLIEIPEAEGGHGGSDPRILERIFLPDPPPDPLGRDATHIDGAASILIGIAANRSIQTGQPIRLDDLLPLPEAEPQRRTAPTV